VRRIARSRSALAIALLATGCSRDLPRDQETPAVSRVTRPLPTDSLIAAGERIYFQGEFDSARVLWRRALALAEPSDSVTEPRVLTWLGLAAYRQGDYPSARTLGERALALKIARGLRSELPKSYNALGLLAWNEGRLKDAGDLFSSALQLAREQGDRELVAKAGNNLGLLQTELGAFGEARANFVSTQEAGRLLGDGKIEGGAFTNLGMLDVWLGNTGAAIESLRRGQRIYRSVGYETGEENVLGQLGTAYAAEGQPGEAFAAIDSAIVIARKQGMRAQEASNLETIAALYSTFGDDQRALDAYAQARAINRELNLQVELANDLRQEAAIRAAAGLLTLAQSGAEQALQVHRAAGARFEELHDVLLLAEIAGQRGSPAAGAAQLQSADRIADELKAPIARARVALTRARLASKAGNPHQVLRVLQSGQGDLQQALSGSAWEVEALRAQAYAATGAFDSSVVAGRRAIAEIERVRSNMGPGPLNSAYLTSRATVYADLALVLLRMGREDEAFAVADGVRAKALLEHLPSVRSRVESEEPRDLIEQERLLHRIDALIARLGEVNETEPEERGPETLVTASELARRLQEARSDYESLVTRVRAKGPRGSALLGVSSRGAEEVRRALRPGEVLLEYLVTPNRVLIFALTPASLEVLESPIGEADLAGRVRLARDLFAQRQGPTAESRQVSEALHAILLQPVERSGVLTGATRIAIVPHGVLNYLPFAALRDEKTGRALIDEYSLWTLPNASALPALRGAARDLHRESEIRGVVYAPYPDRLPATRVEAASFRHAMERGVVRLGQDATEASLREALSRGDLVHVASHGVLNALNPLFSRIDLARGSDAPENDGRLEVHELLDLPIRSPLVYLSGCETGLGLSWSTDFARNEDFTTLGQSFLYAGARNVVATLWRIEDAGAAAFAERFYVHLRQLSPADALAAAQRDLRQDPRYGAPYYWAAYFLTGEGS
jgi:CHAT domain-containing protein/tetratricopeptide (TPR) repeat protein